MRATRRKPPKGARGFISRGRGRGVWTSLKDYFEWRDRMLREDKNGRR
jgi:hypothetical protein